MLNGFGEIGQTLTQKVGFQVEVSSSGLKNPQQVVLTRYGRINSARLEQGGRVVDTELMNPPTVQAEKVFDNE